MLLGCLLWQPVPAQEAGAFAIYGYQDINQPVRWSDSSLAAGLSFSIAPGFLSGSGTDPAGAVRDAFLTWDAASPDIGFYETIGPRLGPYQGANIDVFAVPDTFKYAGYSMEGLLALTFVGVYNGEILGADIFFNKGFSWSDNPDSSQFDIQSVALHEIGHALGLDHPDVATSLGRDFDASGAQIAATGNEVMNSTIAPGEISRVLTEDDLAGLAFLYPTADAVLVLASTVTASPAVPTPEPGSLLLISSGLAGLYGLARRRPRRGPAR